MDAGKLIEMLSLEPLSFEGGFFSETYRCAGKLMTGSGEKNYSTAIYYLLCDEEKSRIHRLKFDEVFHFYLGDPVEMFLFKEDGSFERRILGTALDKGEEPQIVVLAGCWQGARLRAGGKYALMGTTVSPGFDRRDFELGRREELMDAYPGNDEVISILT